MNDVTLERHMTRNRELVWRISTPGQRGLIIGDAQLETLSTLARKALNYDNTEE